MLQLWVHVTVGLWTYVHSFSVFVFSSVCEVLMMLGPRFTEFWQLTVKFVVTSNYVLE
jgi:hypothetical protein